MFKKTPSQNDQLLWIDVLRGLSAYAVVLFHMRVDLWVGWNSIHRAPEQFSVWDRAIALLSLPMPLMGSTVMMFFLLSGFCIHWPYAGGNKTLDLKPYFIRRFFRIYPSYLVIILISLLSEWLARILIGQPMSSVSKFAESLLMIQNYGLHPGQLISNPSLWSLPIEMELYLAYPVFWYLVKNVNIRFALTTAAIVSIGSFLFLICAQQQWLSFNFTKFWFMWCLGAYLAESLKKSQLPKWRSWFWSVASLSVLAASFLTFRNIGVDFCHYFWALSYFLLFLWCLHHKEKLLFLNERFLRGLIFLGVISYSLYLIHFPFFRLCGAIWIKCFGGKPSDLLVPFAFSGVCVFVAFVFYRLIEKPSHECGRQLAARLGKGSQ